jgi:phage/plasmid-associated DNA primase
MTAKYKATHSKGKYPELRRFGMYDKVYQPWRELLLTELIENFICYDTERRILVGDDNQTIYAYNGAYFEKINLNPIRFLQELIRRAFRLLEVGSNYQYNASEKIAKICCYTLTSSDEFAYRPNKRYIAFKNGVFDLKDGRVRDFSINYKPHIALNIDCKDSAVLVKDYASKYGLNDNNPARLWERKITEILPNKDMRDAFQMFCGILLADRNEVKFEYIAYLVGPGSNGKSVLASAITGVFGEEYISHFSLKQLFKDSDARVNIAALQGKLINLVGDLDAKDISGGDFKRAISGEKFQGRRNYGDPISVDFPPILCCANEIPESSDDSWGHHRRQLGIYTTSYQWGEKDKDPYLAFKLTTDDARQYIFTWIYEGYRKLIRNGGNIILGEDVLAAQRALQDHSNSGRCWWSEYNYTRVETPREKDPRWRSLGSLYEEYRAYADECGYTVIKRRREIADMLKSKGFDVKLGNIRRMSAGYEYCVGRLGIDTDDLGNLIENA